MPVNQRLVMVGAGAFAREVICWIGHARASQPLPGALGFIDKQADVLDGARYGAEFLGTIEDFQPGPGDLLVMGIGDPAAKQRVSGMLRDRGGRFATIVHPTAVLAATAVVEEGAVICPHALVSADGHVGQLVAINTLSSVGHDVRVGDFSTLSSHVDLMGGVEAGEGVFFGSGARAFPGVKIGPGAKIGAGATLMRNVAPGATMYGPTAKKL